MTNAEIEELFADAQSPVQSYLGADTAEAALTLMYSAGVDGGAGDAVAVPLSVMGRVVAQVRYLFWCALSDEEREEIPADRRITARVGKGPGTYYVTAREVAAMDLNTVTAIPVNTQHRPPARHLHQRRRARG